MCGILFTCSGIKTIQNKSSGKIQFSDNNLSTENSNDDSMDDQTGLEAAKKPVNLMLNCRGPDFQWHFELFNNNKSIKLQFFQTLLQLRGSQPLAKSMVDEYENVLLFNGEIYSGFQQKYKQLIQNYSQIQYESNIQKFEFWNKNSLNPNQELNSDLQNNNQQDQNQEEIISNINGQKQQIRSSNQQRQNSQGQFLKNLKNDQILDELELNDGFCLFELLRNSNSKNEVINFLNRDLRGPWSLIFYHKKTNTIYFGKDHLGRRSLLYGFQNGVFILSSVIVNNDFINKQNQIQKNSFFPQQIKINGNLQQKNQKLPNQNMLDMSQLEKHSIDDYSQISQIQHEKNNFGNFGTKQEYLEVDQKQKIGNNFQISSNEHENVNFETKQNQNLKFEQKQSKQPIFQSSQNCQQQIELNESQLLENISQIQQQNQIQSQNLSDNNSQEHPSQKLPNLYQQFRNFQHESNLNNSSQQQQQQQQQQQLLKEKQQQILHHYSNSYQQSSSSSQLQQQQQQFQNFEQYHSTSKINDQFSHDFKEKQMLDKKQLELRELPPGIFSLDLNTFELQQHDRRDSQLMELMEYSRKIEDIQPNIKLNNSQILEQYARIGLEKLGAAVHVRCSTINNCYPYSQHVQYVQNGQKLRDDSPIMILFSGGVDSTLLAALSHQSIQPHLPIDLVNVCFDGGQSPDRLSALDAFQELQNFAPQRQFRLILVDSDLDEVDEIRDHLIPVLQPCDTVMDFNIGAALWLAAKGTGYIHQDNQTQNSHMHALCNQPFENGSDLNFDQNAQKNEFTIRNDCMHAQENRAFDGSVEFNIKSNEQDECTLKNQQMHAQQNQPFEDNIESKKVINEKDDVLKGCNSLKLEEQKLKDGFARNSYTSQARVVLLGHGADEQCGGYGRHRTKFREAGWEGLHKELAKDVENLWIRNLGRDDRLIADHGREARHPFLDEDFMHFILNVPLEIVCDATKEIGVGDKQILREMLKILGLPRAAKRVKRAIQFGTRIGKLFNKRDFGSNRAANLKSAGQVRLKDVGRT